MAINEGGSPLPLLSLPRIFCEGEYKGKRFHLELNNNNNINNDNNNNNNNNRSRASADLLGMYVIKLF